MGDIKNLEREMIGAKLWDQLEKNKTKEPLYKSQIS